MTKCLYNTTMPIYWTLKTVADSVKYAARRAAGTPASELKAVTGTGVWSFFKFGGEESGVEKCFDDQGNECDCKASETPSQK